MHTQNARITCTHACSNDGVADPGAKERERDRNNKLKEAGEDPKMRRKLRAKSQEQHVEDGGSDVEPLKETGSNENVDLVGHCWEYNDGSHLIGETAE